MEGLLELKQKIILLLNSNMSVFYDYICATQDTTDSYNLNDFYESYFYTSLGLLVINYVQTSLLNFV